MNTEKILMHYIIPNVEMKQAGTKIKVVVEHLASVTARAEHIAAFEINSFAEADEIISTLAKLNPELFKNFGA